MTLTKIASTGVEDSLRWVLGANGTSDYTFTGPGLTGTVNDPTIYLTRGHTYIFQNNSGGHPFYIKTSIANGGTNDAYNTGVTNNGGGNGTEIVFTVPHDSPDILYYQCSSHASMAGQFNIAGSVADGSITTAKIADDAVTNDKLANSVVASIAANTAKTTNATHTGDVTGSTSLTIANNAVTTAKIADTAVTLAKLEHGTSSNDGKFLRANNGADPTFETVTGTTINNNADNRVITGSGTANTLEGESQLTYDNSTNILKLASASSTSHDLNFLHIVGGGTATRGLRIGTGRSTGASQNHGMVFYDAIDSESNEYGAQHIFRRGGHNNMVIGYQSNNYVGINNDYPNYELSVKATDSNESTIQILAGGNGKESNLLFGAPDDADVGAIKYDHNGDQMKFIVGTSEKFRVNSHGICIGGTGSANALDDYEEGGFTPTYDGTWTNISNTHVRHAKYTKIGNTVHIWMEYFMTNNNGAFANGAAIRNFPYSGPSSLYVPASLGIMYGGPSYSMDQTSAGRCYFDAGDDRLYFRMGSFSGVRHIWIQFTYPTA